MSHTLSIRPLLSRIGLDEREIEIYLALLPLKTARASVIAKTAKQSRSHTYLILKKLEEKGLVSEIERGKILHFVVEPPERLLSYLKDREQQYKDLQPLLKGALPILQSLTTPYVGSPRVTVLKGMEGMKQSYRDILMNEYVAFYNPQSSYEMFDANIVTMLFGKEVKLRGKDLLVKSAGAERYIKEVKQHEEYEIRLLPDSIAFHTDTIVFGDTIALFAFDDEKTIVRIENKNIADSFRAWHAALWEISSKMNC